MYQTVLSIDVGIRNLAICVYRHSDKNITYWKLIDIGMHGPDTCQRMVAALDREAFPAFDAVLVERQPGKNKTMVRMEAYLHAYFATKGHAVVLYGAVHKLKGTGQENSGRKQKDYAARKKASVDLTTAFLEANPQQDHAVCAFRTCKKKDDMADSLLQAVSYFETPPPKKACLDPPKARKPTEKQLRTGKYSAANIVYLVHEKLRTSVFAYVEHDSTRAVATVCAGDAKLVKSMQRLYGTVEAAIQALGLVVNI